MALKDIEPRTKLESFLRSRGIQQQKLVEKVNSLFPYENISPCSLSNIVTGKQKNWEVRTVQRLCKALDCTPNDIVDY